jgi:tight adherence protein C
MPIWIAFGTFFAILLLLASLGLLLFNREAKPKKTPSVYAALPEKKDKDFAERVRRATTSIGSMVGQLEGIVPKSQAEVSVVQQRLIRSGYRKDSAVQVFYGAKLVSIVGFLTLALTTGLASQNYFIVILMSLVLGFLAPDFWLGNRIKARQKRIRLGFPDVLDLLIICVEAGLGLDQATSRAAVELSKSKNDIGDELSIVVLEQRAGLHRADAWRHFSDRTDVPVVRNVVSMLIQSEQFGTSIAKTLRVHSESLRTARIQQVEEQAAKTGIKLLFPLVFFIFPSLFIVTLGPAVILMVETFANDFHH